MLSDLVQVKFVNNNQTFISPYLIKKNFIVNKLFSQRSIADAGRIGKENIYCG